MKRDRQTVENRRAKILATVRERQEIKVDELAEMFEVSLMTIRRDLQHLEDEGLLNRFYGGATVESKQVPAGGDDELQTYRKALARYVERHLKSGNTVFINGSNTALEVLSLVADKSIRAITNNGNVVGVRYADTVTVTLLGGTVRGGGHVMTGDFTMRNLLMATADVALLGCTGISPDGEILCDIPTEIGVNETMASHATECIIMCDHTKMGKTGTYASSSLEHNLTVVTDELAPMPVVERLRAIGQKVVLIDSFGNVVAK